MKKEYEPPEFELIKFSFDAALSTIADSDPENGAGGGVEGGEGEFGDEP